MGERFTVTSNVAVHLRLGPAATVAATATDYLLASGEQLEIETWKGNTGLAGITDGGAGTVFVSPRRTF